MIANYLLKREYLDRLVDGGVLRALCHLSESGHVGVLNFVGLAMYRIAQVCAARTYIAMCAAQFCSPRHVSNSSGVCSYYVAMNADLTDIYIYMYAAYICVCVCVCVYLCCYECWAHGS